MTNAIQQVNKTNAGLCPHGLPPSACPICSNMGGGGSRVGERPQKAGEMSYHQCAMIGAMMAARARRIENHQRILQQHAEAVLTFQKNIETMQEKMLIFANNLSNLFIFKPVAYTINNILVPVLNTLKNAPGFVAKLLDKLSQIRQKTFDIQDKLVAVYGEIKNFIEKKVSELLLIIKNGTIFLSKIFKNKNSDNDDKKLDDDKKIFNLKTILHKIKSKLKRDDSEDNSRS